jgi:hypothetical protein
VEHHARAPCEERRFRNGLHRSNLVVRVLDGSDDRSGLPHLDRERLDVHSPVRVHRHRRDVQTG